MKGDQRGKDRALATMITALTNRGQLIRPVLRKWKI